MNYLDFTTKVGWPWSADAMEYMQNMILMAQSAASIGGDNYILAGCDDDGVNLSTGLVVINGEILPFEAGVKQPSVIIVESITKKPFESSSGTLRNFYHDRKVRFGEGTGQIAFSTFKRNQPANGLLARVDKIEKMLKPLLGYTVGSDTVYGSWLFWGRPASEIPDGWEAVPDSEWKGRVPVVFDDTQTEFDEVGKEGGEKAHQLTTNELPNFKLKNGVSDDRPPGDAGNVFVYGQTSTDMPGAAQANVGNTGGGTLYQGYTSSIGGDAAHNNLQPYKVVLFIRFIG